MVQFYLVKELKQNINIYSSETIFFFSKQFLKEYSLSFHNLENSFPKKDNNELNLIFFDMDKNNNKINFKNLGENSIVLSNFITDEDRTKNNFIHLVSPITIDQIKSEISKFFISNKIIFNEIVISDKELNNTNNDKTCYLTDIEKDILLYLIRNKNCKKNIIKKNILKISSNIESNSLESHLTRIRKKLVRIETKVKISAKNDELLLHI